MSKKAIETGFVSLEELSPKGIGAKDTVIYDGKIYKIMSVDLYEHLIGIDECGDGSICWKRTESIDKYIPFNN